MIRKEGEYKKLFLTEQVQTPLSGKLNGGLLVMIDGFLLCWYLLTLLSLLFLVWDQIRNTPSLPIMGVAWFLILLYTGPIGLFLYLLSCRQPLPNTHDAFIQAHWKQAVGSVIHCVAGDATAIILAAALLHYFPLPNGLESLVEYVAAYLFGLFIFQALFMRGMFASYWEAVRKTLFVETVSMNLVMAGMIPVVLIIKHLYPEASDPLRPYFWGMMSLATLAGFILAYPINSWLVKIGAKHGMMSRSMNAQHAHHAMAQKESHAQSPLSFGISLWTLIWTYGLLILVIYLISLWFPVRFWIST